VSPGDLASLIVATFDLKVVQSIRDAIRTADISSGRPQPVSGLGPAPNPQNWERRFRLHPEPVIEPRRHFHPEPKIEPREIKYTVRYKPVCVPLPSCPPPEFVVLPVPAAAKCPEEGPLPPVWAKLPPIPIKPPSPPRRVIKMSAVRSDIPIKGIVLDVQI